MKAPIPYLWWKLKQASEEIKPSAMGHAKNYVHHPTICTHLEQLMEKAHHTLCSFTPISLHRGKLGGQEVVKFLLEGKANY